MASFIKKIKKNNSLQLLPLVWRPDTGPGVQGQELLVTWNLFIHSIPTTSLQCLWQFTPQSAERERERQQGYDGPEVTVQVHLKKLEYREKVNI